MRINRVSSVSKRDSLEGMGDYWDRHDAGKIRSKTKPVACAVRIASEVIYYEVEREMAEEIRLVARRRVSAATLLNRRVREKISA